LSPIALTVAAAMAAPLMLPRNFLRLPERGDCGSSAGLHTGGFEMGWVIVFSDGL
jgi:hypothetical protein